MIKLDHYIFYSWPSALLFLGLVTWDIVTLFYSNLTFLTHLSYTSLFRLRREGLEHKAEGFRAQGRGVRGQGRGTQGEGREERAPEQVYEVQVEILRDMK